jgi:hypothetical protein
MEQLAVPWLFMGPSGSGKLSAARALIEAAHGKRLELPLEARMFDVKVGDGYKARVLASPYHFEIDIPNLSMQDKQIIGELLTTFFSSGDVLNSLHKSTRKLVILRRAHSLSLPAAIRVRAILQQYVFPPDAAGMIWLTAREMTGPLAILEDAFVQKRIPRLSYTAWSTLSSIPTSFQTEEAWAALEGRPERAMELARFFPEGAPAWPRRIQDFYDEVLTNLLEAAKSGKAPTVAVVLWIRQRVYQALSFCQTGPEIMDSCAAALQRRHKDMDAITFFKAMRSLTMAEPHTSYRTPLSLEAGILALFEALRGVTTVVEKPSPIEKTIEPAQSVAPPPPQNVVICSTGSSGKDHVEPSAIEHALASCDAVLELVSTQTKAPAKRRAPARQKTTGR